jgi:hypothetical protein
MATTQIASVAYASTAALPLTPVRLPGSVSPTASAPIAANGALPASGSSNAAASATVRFSPLGQAASAIAALQASAQAAPAANAATARAAESATVSGNVARARDNATRIAEALAVLDQSIGNLSALDNPDSNTLDFLSNASLSQQLLAAGLTDTVNGRATATSLAAIGLNAQSNGSFSVDRTLLEASFRNNPAGVLALITDYSRNLDGFFAQQASSGLDLTSIGSAGGLFTGAASGDSAFSSLGDFNTRRALAAFKAISLL